MSDQPKLGRDGLPDDDVSHYPASAKDMQAFSEANQALAQFQAPVLVHTNDPHERLYIAALDGTGNDKYTDPLHATNVARLSDQISPRADTGHNRIATGYVEGPGTQDNPITHTLDGALGYTYNMRIEQIYQKFIDQSRLWLKEDPNAKISIADIGFSRGAVEAASFARLVHERGIQDPTGPVYTYNSAHQITHVEYTHPPLVEPGQIAQVVGLFDPVATGEPSKHDRRLPPSVISGIEIISRDEHRSLFPSNHIIDPGTSVDGRFLAVILPDAHCGIGGGYMRNGLSTRSGNLMTDYLNALSDQPYLAKSAESNDPRMNVIHRSDEGMLLYRLTPKIDRLKPEGYNELLVPIQQAGYVPDPRSDEPRNEVLSSRFEHRSVAIGSVPLLGPLTTASLPKSSISNIMATIDGLLNAAQSGNETDYQANLHTLADTDAARAIRGEAKATVDRQEQLASTPSIMQRAPTPEKPAQTMYSER